MQYSPKTVYKPKIVKVVDNNGTPNIEDDKILAIGYLLQEPGPSGEFATILIECLLTGEQQEWDYKEEEITIQYEVNDIRNLALQSLISAVQSLKGDDIFSDEEKKEIFLSHFPVIDYVEAKRDRILGLPLGTWKKFNLEADKDELFENIEKAFSGGGNQQIYRSDKDWEPSRLNQSKEALDLAERYKAKFSNLISTKLKEKLEEIKELIDNEDEQELKDEYTSLRDKLNNDVELFLKENLRKDSSVWEIHYVISSQWPTLLNPSPFKTTS